MWFVLTLMAAWLALQVADGIVEHRRRAARAALDAQATRDRILAVKLARSARHVSGGVARAAYITLHEGSEPFDLVLLSHEGFSELIAAAGKNATRSDGL